MNDGTLIPFAAKFQGYDTWEHIDKDTVYWGYDTRYEFLNWLARVTKGDLKRKVWGEMTEEECEAAGITDY